MSKSLVIVESPAKAKTIGKILGPSFIIKASMGHVRDLPEKEFGVDVNDTFVPKYVPLARSKKLIKELKDIAKDSLKVYMASDPDREGEAIAWHLSELLNHSDVYRVTFNEITETAVKNAFTQPMKIDMSKVNSQQARRILDRIVGYKISPLLWKRVRKGLSAGRVQSVAVMLVCDRDKEIDSFVPEEYWSLLAQLSQENSKQLFAAKLKKIKDKPAKLANESETKSISETLKQETFTVADITSKQKQQWAPPPFITSHLQQSAAVRLRFSVQKTMQIAQQLYEGVEMGAEGNVGLITYMRTDSYRISNEARNACKEYIAQAFGKEYLPEKPRVYKAKKGSQDAHEAIRPSYINKTPEKIKEYLTNDQYKLYSLIWDRFIASQMKPAKLKITTVSITAGDCLFSCEGRDVLFPGFFVITKNTAPQNEEDEDQVVTQLPILKKGEQLTLHGLEEKQHFTKPPARFTEASLVRALEEKEIGRPSTYAPTIQTIVRRGYVDKEKGKLFATDLGKTVTDILVKSFPDIINIAFTASMENNLDSIEDGKKEWKTLLKDFYKSFMVDVLKATQEAKKIKKPVVYSDEVCEKCGAKMAIKSGKFGEFLACSAFPRCKNTKSLETPEPCPEEGCDGTLMQRQSKKGRRFLGCSNYPKCTHTKNLG